MSDETTAVEIGRGDEGLSLLDLLVPVAEHLRLVVFGPIIAGLAALGITFAIGPTFTARTTLLPPQQQQSTAASALASLGALSGLAGAAINIKNPTDQYVALMQSATVADRIIDQFKLMQVYDLKYRSDARKELAKNVRIAAGKKDGLITVEVDDKDPKRAAEMANRHVDELRLLTGQLALTEAQQRRVFFEAQLAKTRDHLIKAQLALQASGFNPSALKVEPKAAAEGYTRLRAEVTAAEVRLQSLRRNLADAAPEIQQQQAALGALRAELAKAEASSNLDNGPDYVSKYREFKYQETLFDLFSRQYEMARLDESREGALIQVVDRAVQPEKKSRPKRAIAAVAATLCALLLVLAFVIIRHFWHQAAGQPRTAAKITRLRATVSRRWTARETRP